MPKVARIDYVPETICVRRMHHPTHFTVIFDRQYNSLHCQSICDAQIYLMECKEMLLHVLYWCHPTSIELAKVQTRLIKIFINTYINTYIIMTCNILVHLQHVFGHTYFKFLNGWSYKLTISNTFLYEYMYFNGYLFHGF